MANCSIIEKVLPGHIIDDITKWDKWKQKNGSDIMLTTKSNNNIVFTIADKSFKILYSHDSNNNMLMIETNDYFPWLNKVISDNIKKSFTLYKLLKHINKQCTKESIDRDEHIDLDIDVNNFYDDEELLNEFDIKEVKYEKQLKKNLHDMKSSLNGDLTSKTSKISELFKGNVPGHILLNVFMEMRKKYNKYNSINVSLYEDNIYHWIITFTKFKNNELSSSLGKVNTLYGYDTIQLEILFHDKMFPAYPPFLKIIRPRMDNSLMHRISNLKMVHVDYWTPSRTMDYIIDKLYNIFNEHAVIDADNVMNDKNKYPIGAYHELEAVLVKFASLCNVENQFAELDQTEYKNVVKEPSTNLTTTKKSNKCWASGTGYGYSGASDWNIDEYVQIQQERDENIQSIIQIVTNVLMNTEPLDILSVYKIIESSYLIPYIKTILMDTTMVEIDKHKQLYKLIFTLLQFLITEESMFLFDDQNGKKTLFAIIQELYSEALTVQKISKHEDDQTNDEDYDITSMITSLFEFLHSCYTIYITTKKNIEEPTIELHSDDKSYVTELSKYKFDMHPFIKNGFYHNPKSSTNKKLLRSLGKECSTFNKSLPIHYGSSVLARVDSTNSRCMRVLITGPNDTPYDSGIYLFDIYAPDTFPDTNPLMQFINHGGVRFNPNLYACGKVCLSLLGTWRGTASENWNPKTSTMTQLFISVQAQILTDDPHYNEPGYEKENGTKKGKDTSRIYNNYIRQFNMQHAMISIIESVLDGKYDEYKDAIITHFKLKKDYIIELCEKWTSDSFDTTHSMQHNFPMTKQKYTATFDKLKECLDKICYLNTNH
jgi:ubiquitin-protein ligase